MVIWARITQKRKTPRIFKVYDNVANIEDNKESKHFKIWALLLGFSFIIVTILLFITQQSLIKIKEPLLFEQEFENRTYFEIFYVKYKHKTQDLQRDNDLQHWSRILFPIDEASLRIQTNRLTNKIEEIINATSLTVLRELRNILKDLIESSPIMNIFKSIVSKHQHLSNALEEYSCKNFYMCYTYLLNLP